MLTRPCDPGSADFKVVLKLLLQDVVLFARHASQLTLRGYQVDVARAIVASVLRGLGDTIVVIFPRQSGKNELQAQVEAYLLTFFSQMDCELVKVSPTWKPQTLNAMRRLERVLERNLLTRGRWKKESGYIYRLGRARIFFLSGDPTANVVGATASTLLECDEAQDVQTAKWDKDFAPMAASTNATRVLWGTMWTSQTLLARELRAARAAQAQDGRRRVFLLNADQVRREVPAYGLYVDEQVRRLGRNHPLIRTQYYSEEIESGGGMFTPARRERMIGAHSWLEAPRPGQVYALLLDVAGEDAPVDGNRLLQATPQANEQRDLTALTVVEVDLGGLADEFVRAPTYRVVHRLAWRGVAHSTLYAILTALAERWQARWLVVDATGVGAGLASFLEKALPGRVIPYLFSTRSKSDLGWGFLAMVEMGRYREYQPTPGEAQRLQEEFWAQAAACQAEVLPGAGRVLRWGVPDGWRDEVTGNPLHDDLLLSAALCAVLDKQPWGLALSNVVHAADPLDGMGEVY